MEILSSLAAFEYIIWSKVFGLVKMVQRHYGIENKGRDFIRTGSLSFESEITNLDNHIYYVHRAW